MRFRFSFFVGALFVVSSSSGFAAERVRVGAAEQIYADIASQIGGSAISVELIENPKLASRASADAHAKHAPVDIAIYNGAGYDDWVEGFLNRSSVRPVMIEVARFSPKGPGQNPFRWYDFVAVGGMAKALAAELSTRDPTDAQLFSRNLEAFETAIRQLSDKLNKIGHDYAGSDVFMPDNLGRSIVAALHFDIQNEAYLKEIADGEQPMAKSVAALRKAVTMRKASILIYDSEKKDSVTEELVSLAKDNDVPVVGLRETKPASLNYQQWMMRQLNIVHGALNEAAP